jgi:hypothetical protein
MKEPEGERAARLAAVVPIRIEHHEQHLRDQRDPGEHQTAGRPVVGEHHGEHLAAHRAEHQSKASGRHEDVLHRWPNPIEHDRGERNPGEVVRDLHDRPSEPDSRDRARVR